MIWFDGNNADVMCLIWLLKFIDVNMMDLMKIMMDTIL